MTRSGTLSFSLELRQPFPGLEWALSPAHPHPQALAFMAGAAEGGLLPPASPVFPSGAPERSPRAFARVTCVLPRGVREPPRDCPGFPVCPHQPRAPSLTNAVGRGRCQGYGRGSVLPLPWARWPAPGTAGPPVKGHRERAQASGHRVRQAGAPGLGRQPRRGSHEGEA